MVFKSEKGLSDAELRAALEEYVDERMTRLAEQRRESGRDAGGKVRVLMLPPDFTRMYSGAGHITAMLTEIFAARAEEIEWDVMPALGTHVPMSREECETFFEGRVDYEKLLVHNWRDDVVKIGEVPGEFVSEVSEGLVSTPIDVEVNRRIVSGDYDLIYSIGQVVPHEVVGMANYSKNIFVGCGGSSMINSSHMLGAFYGMERIMGQRSLPRAAQVFDYAAAAFSRLGLPLGYIADGNDKHGRRRTHSRACSCGRERSGFEQAVSRTQQRSMNFIRRDRPIKHCVVLPRSRASSRAHGSETRRSTAHVIAMADGGELTVLAPGVERFGEDEENDQTDKKVRLLSAARTCIRLVDSPERRTTCKRKPLRRRASDPRQRPTAASTSPTAPRRSADGRRGARQSAMTGMPYDGGREALRPRQAHQTAGNTPPDGEEFYYISNPALGLWSV